MCAIALPCPRLGPARLSAFASILWNAFAPLFLMVFFNRKESR